MKNKQKIERLEAGPKNKFKNCEYHGHCSSCGKWIGPPEKIYAREGMIICAECNKKELSDCCGAEVIVKGDTTKYYICNSCDKPCSLKSR